MMQLLRIVRLFSLMLLSCKLFATDMHGYCGENGSLFNIADRPSAADSVCAVSFGKQVLEMGYQSQHILLPNGRSRNFPDLEYRLGIPEDNEIFVMLPNSVHQNVWPYSGITTTSIGFKHGIYTKTDTLLFALEGWVSPPSGDASFGNKGWNATAAGIVTYNFEIPLSWTLMLGVSTFTQSKAFGGGRFASINPDFVLSYTITPRYAVYIETYGQTKTAPTSACGFNIDGGVLFLPRKSWQIDVSAGQNLRGNLNNIENYVSLGMAIMF